MKGGLMGYWEKTVLTGLLGFLWFFYGAIGDKIFPTVDTVSEHTANILNPLAYMVALGNLNLLVLLFPFISFALVILVHSYWGEWWWFGTVLACVFVFDYIIAAVSTYEIHQHMKIQEGKTYEEKWSPFLGLPDYWAHFGIIVLCGFGASFVAGLLYHAFKEKENENRSTNIDVNEFTDIESPDIESPDIEIED